MLKNLKFFRSATESSIEEDETEDKYREMVRVYTDTLKESQLVPVIAKDLPRIIKNINFNTIPKYDGITSEIPQLLYFLLKKFSTKEPPNSELFQQDFQNVILESTDSVMNFLQKYLSDDYNCHVLLNSFTQSLISYPWIFLKGILKDHNINFTDVSWKIDIDVSKESKVEITHLRTEKVKVLFEDDYEVFFKFSWKLILIFEHEDDELELVYFQMKFEKILDFDEKVKPKLHMNEKFMKNLLSSIFDLLPMQNVRYIKF
eukprot:gene4870-8464_t